VIPAGALMRNATAACSTAPSVRLVTKEEIVMRKRLAKTSFLTSILLAALFVAASSAFGEAINPHIFYPIKVRQQQMS